MLLQKSATFILSPQVNSSSQPGHGQSATLPPNFLLFSLLHFLKQNKQNKKHRIKSTVAAVSLLFSQSNCPASAWEWTQRGCSSLLAKISFVPCSCWFWLFSPAFHGERESSQLVPVSGSFQEWKAAHGEGSSFQFLEKIKLQSLVEGH